MSKYILNAFFVLCMGHAAIKVLICNNEVKIDKP